MATYNVIAPPGPDRGCAGAGAQAGKATKVFKRWQLRRPFKYVVTTIIMQKNGAGMDTGAAMHWDSNKDGLVCIPWENAEMHVVLTIYGVSLHVDNVGDEED